MKPLRRLGVLLQEALQDLYRHRGQHALAGLALAAGLLLAGGGLLAVESLDRFVVRLESMARVVVYAAGGQTLEEAQARLKRDPRFQAVRRVSAEENRRRFLATTRDAGVLLEATGLEALPESLELTLRRDLEEAGKAAEVGRSLQGLPGVGDVLVDQDRLDQLHRVARMARSALAGLGLVLLLAGGFATGTVIRMSLLAREDEITIMRLVGATERFILAPLLVEGACLGLLGALLALAGLFALWLPVARGAGGLSPLLVDLARQGFFSAKSMALLATVGAATGALGALWAFLATRRAQRQQAVLAEGGA